MTSTAATTRRPVYTDAERSTAKTLALSLGVARAHDVLSELWAEDGREVPTTNTLGRWRDDKAIPVDRDMAAAYEAGLTVTVSASAERVMLAAETALVAALDGKNLDRLPFASDLLKVWRGATDRLLVAPSAPRDTGPLSLLPTAAALPAGASYMATYRVEAAPAAPALVDVASTSRAVTDE